MAKLEEVIMRGTNGARPAANAVAVGTLYYDTTNSTLDRSNGSAWETVEGAGGGAAALDDLTDVTITSPATDAVLRYNGSAWIDDVAPVTGHNHTSTAGDGGVLTADEHDSFSEYAEIAAPGTPASGKVRLYAKSDGLLYSKDDAGTETVVSGGGGGGGGTATTRIPINLTTPRTASLAGNSFWTVAALTSWDAGHWEYLKDVEGRVYGTVAIPSNMAGTPAASIILAIAANATSGVTRLTVSTKAVADTESLNPGSLTAETAQDITVPGTARLRKDVTFALTETIAADDLLIVELTHNGNHANDTLAVNTELYGAWLEIDITI